MDLDRSQVTTHLELFSILFVILVLLLDNSPAWASTGPISLVKTSCTNFDQQNLDRRCGFSQAESAFLMTQLQDFQKISQDPFDENVEQYYRQLERLEILKPVVRLLIEKPQCAQQEILLFKDILLKERAGQPLSVDLESTDNHFLLARSIEDLDMITQPPSQPAARLDHNIGSFLRIKDSVPARSLVLKFSNQVQVYENLQNFYQCSPADKVFFVDPDFVVENYQVTEKENGEFLHQLKIQVSPIHQLAHKNWSAHPQVASDPVLSSWSLSQWKTTGIERLFISIDNNGTEIVGNSPDIKNSDDSRHSSFEFEFSTEYKKLPAGFLSTISYVRKATSRQTQPTEIVLDPKASLLLNTLDN